MEMNPHDAGRPLAALDQATVDTTVAGIADLSRRLRELVSRAQAAPPERHAALLGELDALVAESRDRSARVAVLLGATPQQLQAELATVDPAGLLGQVSHG